MQNPALRARGGCDGCAPVHMTRGCAGRHYRLQVCESLGRDWLEELEWVTDLAADNPKNYQIWQYRKQLIMRIVPGARSGSGGGGAAAAAAGSAKLPSAEGVAAVLAAEPRFVEEHLSDDSKNYHAWAYRQWLVGTFGLWEAGGPLEAGGATAEQHDGEMAFVERMISADVCNNSAWNHRFAVVCHRAQDREEAPAAAPGCGGGAAAGHVAVLKASTHVREITYAFSCLMAGVENESPWRVF